MDARFLVAAVLLLGLFGFLSVIAWSRERRREREAYYRHEVHKRLAESAGAGANAVLEVLREEERIAARQRRQAHRVGGLVTIAAGLGVTVFLKVVDQRDPDPAWVVGVIPLLVGAALLVYSWFFAPRE